MISLVADLLCDFSSFSRGFGVYDVSLYDSRLSNAMNAGNAIWNASGNVFETFVDERVNVNVFSEAGCVSVVWETGCVSCTNA